MASDDWRRLNDEFHEPLLSRNLALRDALQPIALRHRVSIAAVAIAWTLTWPGVSGAIVGARSPQQVDGWIAAGNLALEAEELAEIAGALERTRAGAGPKKPVGSADDAYARART
jgi:aryl-alcohol dehydrogenase-like predicted oxidoreductase